MAAVGNNYAKRNEGMSLKEYNQAWSAKRREAIEKGATLRSSITSGVFTTNAVVVQQQVVNSIQGTASAYSSNTATMSRINMLI